jgi:DNA damage-binding protein 1
LEEGTSINPIKVAPETFNVRLEELAVIDLAFLAPTSRTAAGAAAGSSSAAAAADSPVLALLYEDAKHARHIKTYTLNLQTKVRVGVPLPPPRFARGEGVVL